MQSPEDLLAHQVNVRQTELLFRHGRISCIGNLSAVALVVVMYWQALPGPLLLAWGAATSATMLYRARLMQAFDKRDRYGDILPWLQRFNSNVGVNGVLWGLMFAAMALLLPAGSMIWYMMILGALFAGSGIAYNSYLRTFLYYTVPAVLPAVLILLLRFDPESLGLAAGTLSWFALVYSFAHQFHSQIRLSSSYEFENVLLLNRLSMQRELSNQLREEIALKSQIIDQLHKDQLPRALLQ